MPEHKTCIVEAAARLTEPFTHWVLGRVDDHCVYVSRFSGTHRFHKHDKDEMYLVWDGEIYIDYYDGPSVLLRSGEALVLKAGEQHRSRAEKQALVLMFKAAQLFAE